MRLSGRRAVAVVAASTLVWGGGLLFATNSASAAGVGGAANVLVVSPQAPEPAGADVTGSNHSEPAACDHAQYSTIGSAVAAANPGQTVYVCPGTYNEDVVVGKALTLVGHDAIIDAAGFTTGPQDNGIQVLASNVTITGFTVENAFGEGILVGADLPKVGLSISHVTIADNAVINNDRGFSGPGGSTSTCFYPGDCGGGIHLNSVSEVTVSDNRVTGNADGILLTDEFGPNFDNVVSSNYVADNLTECGIVLPSHNGGAVSFGPAGQVILNKSAGGVFDNKVLDNLVIGNGTVVLPNGGGGSGSGIGMFTPFPGTASYDNLIQGNQIFGNGQSGVTLHAHAPGQYLSGNVVTGNVIGRNNLGGDPFDHAGPPLSDFATTGVAVYSLVVPLQITVTHNVIFDNTNGVWMDSPPVIASGLGQNLFFNDTKNVLNAG